MTNLCITAASFLLSSLFVVQSSPVQLNGDPCQRDGPEYWCRNQQTATECGVLNFCKKRGFNSAITNNVVKPLQFELYFESLCPDCRNFFKEQLWPAYQQLYDTGIFDITLYSYGNANEKKEGDNWVFTCQHGAEECQLNLLETCVLHMLTHPKQFMPYINCVELDPSLARAKHCADEMRIEWQPIFKCYNGSEGNFLEHQVAVKTDSLEPKHTWVPWIVLDGAHTKEIQDAATTNLSKLLCEQYKGTTPDTCNDIIR
eukprot:TCONS_00001756-protein